MIVKDADRMRKLRLPKKYFLKNKIYSKKYKKYRLRKFMSRK